MDPVIKITEGRGKNRGTQTITITTDSGHGAGFRIMHGLERETAQLNRDDCHMLAADARVLADALRMELMPKKYWLPRP